MESGWNICLASGRDEQEVSMASGSGCNLWVWLVGVVVWRYIILLIPTPLVSVLFAEHPYFFSFKTLFFILVPVLFCNYIISIK